MINHPKSIRAFFKLIRSNVDQYSPSQKRIAEYILTEPNLLAHLSVIDMAKVTNTSQATVIRFCQLLGFKGFLDFSRYVKQLFQAYLSGQARFIGIEEVVNQELEIYGKKFSDVYYANIEEQKSRLDNIIESDDFLACIDAMARAEKIFIFGTMSSYSLSYMFYNMLYRISTKIHLLEIHNTYAYNSFKNVDKNSLFFNIIFPRYPKKSLEFSKLAKEQGATIITITNNEQAPSLELSDYSLITPVNTMLFIDTFTETLGVFTALALKYAQVCKSDTLEGLKKYDEFSEVNNIFLT